MVLGPRFSTGWLGSTALATKDRILLWNISLAFNFCEFYAFLQESRDLIFFSCIVTGHIRQAILDSLVSSEAAWLLQQRGKSINAVAYRLILYCCKINKVPILNLGNLMHQTRLLLHWGIQMLLAVDEPSPEPKDLNHQYHHLRIAAGDSDRKVPKREKQKNLQEHQYEPTG